MLNLQRKNLWLARAQWMLAGAMLLVGGGFYAFAYRPQTAKLTALYSSIDAQRVELSVCKTKTSGLADVRSDVDRLRAKLKEYRIQPAQQEFVQFYKEIGALQQQAGLRNCDTHSDGKIVRRQRLNEQPVTLRFEGDFASVFSFLRQAEDLPRLMRVPKMTIKRSPDKNGQVKVEMTMNLYTSAGE